MQTGGQRKGELFAEKPTSMSVDALRQSPRRLPRPAETADSSPGQRKPSAVERLEADKAKYVKSQQVALNKQLPIIRKPLMPSSNSGQLRPGPPQPMRKVAARTTSKPESSLFNLDHLNSLINGVCDAFSPSNSLQTEKHGESAARSASRLPSPNLKAVVDEPNLTKDFSTPKKKILGDGLAMNMSSPYTVTVRRVDVRPQLAIPQMRKPCRAQLPGQRVHSQLLQLLKPYTQTSPPPQPLQPIKRRHDIMNIPNPGKSSMSPLQASAFSPKTSTPAIPSPDESPKEQNEKEFSTSAQEPILPPSPAVTNNSSLSSRKRSLTRSKSDVSDRFSRAGAEVERFFNYCGLEPSDFEELTPGSDIASISRLRSASTPASKCSAEGEEDEEEDNAAKDEKPSYNISVIEKNARVIKWLYGMRQAKDSTKVANI
ncbi:protein FAM110A [Silurus meridionalis]|nr:protein FAM110A [Silurus meridionalis]